MNICFQIHLSFHSLTMMCLGVDLFEFVLLGVELLGCAV